MFKRFLALSMVALLLLPVAMYAFCFSASAATAQVWVCDSGSDTNNGTESAPFRTLDKAIASLDNNGTVNVAGTLTVTSWTAHSKTVTVKGGELISTADVFNINDNVTFDGIKLTFKAGSTVYANGRKLIIKENVTLTNEITLYGGKQGGTLNGDTDITVLAGNYKTIYGGSNGGTVNGSTRVSVGGSVNSALNVADHGGGKYIYGGGYNTNITGSTTLIFDGNAKSTHLFGGSVGGSSKIGKGTYAYVKGGQSMSIYAASNGVDTKSDATLIMTGGTIQQVFGGCQGSNLTGNVDLRALGGKITRRIYGGCYNEYDNGWKSAYGVKGTIVLTLGGTVTISLDAKDPTKYNMSYPDRSIYARSRQATDFAGEKGILIFANQNTYNTYKSKLGASNDTLYGILGLNMKTIMGNASVATEGTHLYSYSASGATISATCSLCSTAHTETAKLVLTEPKPTYTGSAIECVELQYANGWKNGAISKIEYENNVTPGNASAKASFLDVSATLDFTIAKASPSAPNLSKNDESIKGKNDGRILWVSTSMEYRGAGESAYKPITQNYVSVEPGTYYVRYKETATSLPSGDATVVIKEGRMLTVTFKATGSPDIVKELSWGESLTDIPAVPEREGYTETAPYWSVSEFEDITEDIVVNAIYTKDNENEPEVIPPEDDDKNDNGEEDQTTPDNGSQGEGDQTTPDNGSQGEENKPPVDNDNEALTPEEPNSTKAPEPSGEGTTVDVDVDVNVSGGCGSAIGGVGMLLVSIAAIGFIKKKEN